MINLTALKNGIVKKGFRELKGLEINVGFLEISDAFAGFERVACGKYLIMADVDLARAPIIAIEGCLAHEIAHIAIDFKFGPVRRWIHRQLYFNFKKYQTFDERQKDLLVVQRGYAEHLLEFVKYADSKHEDYTSEDGLTRAELEALLKQKETKA
jgi:hypothetical protein